MISISFKPLWKIIFKDHAVILAEELLGSWTQSELLCLSKPTTYNSLRQLMKGYKINRFYIRQLLQIQDLNRRLLVKLALRIYLQKRPNLRHNLVLYPNGIRQFCHF